MVKLIIIGAGIALIIFCKPVGRFNSGIAKVTSPHHVPFWIYSILSVAAGAGMIIYALRDY